MSNKKQKTAKKQIKKQPRRINWQKLRWPLALLCAGLVLALALSVLFTRGVPVKSASSADGRISLQMRWKGFGRYDSAYAAAPEGREVELNFRRVRRLVAMEFTASSRYGVFVYKGPQGRQYFYVVDYLTGKAGTVEPDQIFKTDLPTRQNATDVKVTFFEMDPEYDAAVFRVDYTMADGQKHYEHITYNFDPNDLQ